MDKKKLLIIHQKYLYISPPMFIPETIACSERKLSQLLQPHFSILRGLADYLLGPLKCMRRTIAM